MFLALSPLLPTLNNTGPRKGRGRAGPDCIPASSGVLGPQGQGLPQNRIWLEFELLSLTSLRASVWLCPPSHTQTRQDDLKAQGISRDCSKKNTLVFSRGEIGRAHV